MRTEPVKIDPVVEHLLHEVDDERVDEVFASLIEDHAQPVIKGVIRYKLRLNTQGAVSRAEAEDVNQEAVLQLLAQLQRFRQSPEEHPITDLRGIAAVIAHRTCSRWLRRRFPERHAFKNRLHYLLTRQRGLSLWQDEHDRRIAGFAVWQTQNKPAIPIQRAAEDSELSNTILRLKSRAKDQLAEIVAAVFNHLGGPLEFDELVSMLAVLLDVKDPTIEPFMDEEGAQTIEPVDDQPDAVWRLEKKDFLKRLWEELQQLPANQRAALLLNLKDASGGGCITLFPATGIASVRQIALALEMPVDSFAGMWNDLPFDDLRIADLLGVTRQQVINARKSGRERLARRLKGFF